LVLQRFALTRPLVLLVASTHYDPTASGVAKVNAVITKPSHDIAQGNEVVNDNAAPAPAEVQHQSRFKQYAV